MIDAPSFAVVHSRTGRRGPGREGASDLEELLGMNDHYCATKIFFVAQAGLPLSSDARHSRWDGPVAVLPFTLPNGSPIEVEEQSCRAR